MSMAIGRFDDDDVRLKNIGIDAHAGIRRIDVMQRPSARSWCIHPHMPPQQVQPGQIAGPVAQPIKKSTCCRIAMAMVCQPRAMSSASISRRVRAAWR